VSERFFWFPSVDQVLADYVSDLENASQGAVCIDIERHDVRDLPLMTTAYSPAPEGDPLIDGHRLRPDAYFRNLDHWANGGPASVDLPLGSVDYRLIVTDPRFDIAGKVERGEANHVWILAPPLLGFWEVAMAGPGAYWVNGAPIEGVPVSRRFVVEYHSTDRGPGNWLHVTSHLAEWQMGHVSRHWPREFVHEGRAFHAWERFSLTEYQNYDPGGVAEGYAQVGTCHYPPNAPAGSNFAWAFENTVLSYADDWYHYPDFRNESRPVNRETWGARGEDYERGFLYWWFDHLPRGRGERAGILNNWWRYIFDVNIEVPALPAASAAAPETPRFVCAGGRWIPLASASRR
jgi:hypothetical protein